VAGIYEIAKSSKVPADQVRNVFNAILDSVKSEPVQIRDFGTFRTRTAGARTIKSPQIPGGVATVPERTVLRFKAAPATREALNNGARSAAKPAKAAKKPAPAAAPAKQQPKKAKTAAPAAE